MATLVKKPALPLELAEMRNVLTSCLHPHQKKLLAFLFDMESFMEMQTRTVTRLQKMVDDMRHVMHHLFFDLEATRREKHELEEILREFERGLGGDE